jgi:competence protein ComEA
MKHKLSLKLFILFVSVCLAAGAAFAQTSPTPAKKGDTSKKAAQIDINSASKQELMTLPGVGDATAQKIIDGRPYRGKNELVQKKIITQDTYSKISGQIIAKQEKAATAKKK